KEAAPRHSTVAPEGSRWLRPTATLDERNDFLNRGIRIGQQSQEPYLQSIPDWSHSANVPRPRENQHFRYRRTLCLSTSTNAVRTEPDKVARPRPAAAALDRRESRAARIGCLRAQVSRVFSTSPVFPDGVTPIYRCGIAEARRKI